MQKRTKANLLCAIGTPATIGWLGFMSVFSSEGNAFDLLWCVPLCAVSLPLIPILFKGENLLLECDKEDFEKLTANLPQVSHTDCLWIDVADDGKAFIGPRYSTEFESEADARLWLIANEYQEVKDVYSSESLATKWVKKNEIT